MIFKVKIICDISFFCLDITLPKGGVVINCGTALVNAGYKVMIFNTDDFKKSMHYNPLAYARHEVA